MMLSLNFLESFDEVTAQDPVHPEYARGLAVGLEQAQNNNLAAKVEQVEALSLSLQNLNFSFSEARAALLLSLEPLFQEVIHCFLPTLREIGEVSQISDLLMDEVNGQLAVKPALSMHPDHVSTLRSLLAPDALARIRIEPDDDAQPGSIWVTCAGADTVIDLAGAVTAVRNALIAVAPRADVYVQERNIK